MKVVQARGRLRGGVEGQISHRWAYSRIEEGWMLEAACSGEDPALWFPRDAAEHYNTTPVALTRVARAICSQCPVVGDCLAYALRLDLRYGTWGGLTEGERAKLTGRRPGGIRDEL